LGIEKFRLFGIVKNQRKTSQKYICIQMCAYILYTDKYTFHLHSHFNNCGNNFFNLNTTTLSGTSRKRSDRLGARALGMASFLVTVNRDSSFDSTASYTCIAVFK
jgi:hypothetical protein